MRHDMYKVIVERPRLGRGYTRCHRKPDDLEESPKQEGLRKRHRNRKHLNENLRPLERFLAAQVGRPWDAVYSEICAGIDRRNTVQQHIHQHLEDFVAMKVVEIDGELRANAGWRVLAPLSSPWAAKYFVHPRHGLLLLNRDRIEARRQLRIQRKTAYIQQLTHARDGMHVIDAATQLHRIDGVWYRIEVAQVSDQAANNAFPIDILRKIPAHQCPTWQDSKKITSNLTLYGRHDVYGIRKQQLNARELRHYRLTNINT